MQKEFRINKTEYVNKTFRMPVDLMEELGKASSDVGVSMNEFVIQATRFALDNLVIDDKREDGK